MTIYYPIVIETETSGAVSAYVPGLPVYAARCMSSIIRAMPLSISASNLLRPAGPDAAAAT